jgi:two-component system phosphate regulon sensor histidine kinase PhoR
MDNRSEASALITKLTFYYACVVLVGLLTDTLLPFLLLASLLLLLWHYVNLHRLKRYLWRSRKFVPPQGIGSWRTVFDGIFKLQMRHQQRRNKLGKLIRRFREGAEALPDAVILISSENVIYWSNSLARQLLGLRWPEDRGQRIDNLLRSPEFRRYICDLNRSEPFIMASPVNQALQLEMRIVPYGDKQRLLVIRDITRMLKLEKIRRDFVANVSHELRTPLTVVKGYLEMLSDPAALDPAMWQQIHRMLVSQTDRMDSLVAQLTELSNIESGKSTVKSQPINVASLLALVESEAQALRGDKQLAIQFSVVTGITLFADPRQLRTIFSNLIFNAVKYTPDGGHIWVTWKASANGARFSVEDDGEGIAAEHLQRLTERFYRVDHARSRDSGGSGLGLSIVKHALANMQSTLEIQSTVGKGSCFSFEIPHGYLEKSGGSSSSSSC